MQKKLLTILLVLSISFLSGCIPEAVYLSENYDSIKPSSIVIYPWADSVMYSEDNMDIINTLQEKIADRNYDVIGMITADAALKSNDLKKGFSFETSEIAKICSVCKADALMYCNMTETSSDYAVLASGTSLQMDLNLFSSDGTLLWKQIIDESQISLGLIPALISPLEGWLTDYTNSLPEGSGNGDVR